MVVSFKTILTVVGSVSVAALTACSSMQPNAMPTGYTYHYQTYKSASTPASNKILVEQRKFMDAAQAEQFRDAVYALLEQLTMRAGMPPKPVYVATPEPMTTFYANIDNDLRESMRHIGYAISDTPEDAYVFAYEATPIPREDKQLSAGEPNVMITLKVFSHYSKEARQLAHESGAYYIQGVELLKVAPPQYKNIPTMEEIEKRQMTAVQPVVEPVLETPVVEQEPIMQESIMSTPELSQQPVFDPVEQSTAEAAVSDIINTPLESDMVSAQETPLEEVVLEETVTPVVSTGSRNRVSLPVTY